MIDPLAKMKATQAIGKRGRLKVFLGMAAGVGKTYGMLTEGHQLAMRGADVVIGYLEPHGRDETERLSHGLETVPPAQIAHRGVSLKEMDLDALLTRRPDTALVDELAHTNAPGSRHAKRWQDVDELLAAGINVLTTVNIQHIESLKDVVAQVTNVIVQETLPDSVLEGADEIELVDIPPEQLHHRLKEGKIYIPEKVDQALQGFFKRSNLLALRELALRYTAERVDKDLRSSRDNTKDAVAWHAGERILVCAAPNRMAPRVVRAAKRLAGSLHAELIAVSVESSRQSRMSPSGREYLEAALRLAESLGARVVGLAGDDIASEVVSFARRENITTIVVGKPVRKRWKEVIFGSVVDDMIRSSGDIDVLVITGAEEAGSPVFRRQATEPWKWQGFLEVMAALALCTFVGRLLLVEEAHLANVVMLYLVGTVFIALRHGMKESVLASFLSVFAVNYFFVIPHFTFAVSDFRYVFTFVVMMAVSVLLSILTLRLRESTIAVSERERTTGALYELSKQLVECRKKVDMATAAARKANELLSVPVEVFVRSESGMQRLDSLSGSSSLEPSEQAVAEWVLDNCKLAGAGTETLSGSEHLYMPLRGSSCAIGVMALRLGSHKSLPNASQRLIEAIADQLAGALERAQFAKESNEATLQAEKEQLRSDLLSSVSHDLRTPLASIQGSAYGLLQSENLDSQSKELAGTVMSEAQRMTRLIENLLDMTRVQGSLALNLDCQSLNDLATNAIERTMDEFDKSVILTSQDADILAWVDGVLLEQVLVNLLENASRYAGRECQAEVRLSQSADRVTIEVCDDGPGIEPGMEEAIFERFRRGGTKGFGLGLAICRAAVEAHGGSISAVNAQPGALFTIILPKGGPLEERHESLGD